MRKRCLCWGKSTTYGLGEGFFLLCTVTRLELEVFVANTYGLWLVGSRREKKGTGRSQERVCMCVFCIGWLVVLGIGNV